MKSAANAAMSPATFIGAGICLQEGRLAAQALNAGFRPWHRHGIAIDIFAVDWLHRRPAPCRRAPCGGLCPTPGCLCGTSHETGPWGVSVVVAQGKRGPSAQGPAAEPSTSHFLGVRHYAMSLRSWAGQRQISDSRVTER